MYGNFMIREHPLLLIWGIIYTCICIQLLKIISLYVLKLAYVPKLSPSQTNAPQIIKKNVETFLGSVT